MIRLLLFALWGWCAGVGAFVVRFETLCEGVISDNSRDSSVVVIF